MTDEFEDIEELDRLRQRSEISTEEAARLAKLGLRACRQTLTEQEQSA